MSPAGFSYFSNDTIVAIATSLAGDAGVGIIRLSGPQALEAARAITRGLEEPTPRVLHRIEVVDTTGAVVDDGLGVFFEEGHSFTGEPVIELQLHGGRYLLQTILNLALQTTKCRLALPGEFSFRAVRNGKQTLTAAQALSQIISAKSEGELKAARENLSKTRIEEFEKLARGIRELLAKTELSIDFSDQDVEVISGGAFLEAVQSLQRETEKLREGMLLVRRLSQGVRVTLAGRPNAGKSTVFNAILAEERALVSPDAGTTRDVITEELRLGPYYVRLADTAGLRDSTNRVEQEGVERARATAGASDFVIYVIDGTREAADVLAELDAQTLGADVLLIVNKADEAGPKRCETLRFALTDRGYHALFVSGKTSDGIHQLLQSLKESFDSKYGLAASAFLPTEFQLQMILKCRDGLAAARALAAKDGMKHPELISASLAAAVGALSDLVGETTPDTVLAQIFSEFCIGK